nr:TadE/TadG family type IV pilus assembly protein [Dactylosporangium sucinum]
MQRRDGQRGSVTVELAILAPSMLLLASFAMLVGRVSLANAAVDAAAYSAARAASLSRDAATAQRRAEESVVSTLDGQGLRCLTLLVAVDTSQFARDAGEPASVTVTVECRVDLSAGALPGTPTDRWIRVEYASPLDLFRSRAG